MRDVSTVLEAASRIEVSPDELVRSTGLSREGVELALARHLETSATDEELASLVRRAGHAESVLVILSANVFVAALRAIAVARAASERVVVRPSRREPVFARALVRALASPSVTIDEAADPSAFAEVHVYGRDETIARVRAAAGSARVHGHGAGMGVAFVGAPTGEAAEALAADVVPFDQRGCLSPRVALVAGDAGAFARALHSALAAWRAKVPRGAIGPEEAAEAARYAATVAYAGELLEAHDHTIGVAGTLLVPPPGRCVHVARVASAEAARALLAPIAKYVVTLGAANAREASLIAPPHARPARLGEMQRPPLDGPVDLRP
jgi:hypothetical protein